jgi:DNA invertase Pin-like site-specific DNA recombinase
MHIGYARTSTVDQVAGLDAQIAALKGDGCEKTFIEQVSAKENAPRPELEAAIEFAREGDTFVATKLDRLARSLVDLLTIVKRLEAKRVALRVLSFSGGKPIDTSNPQDKLLLSMMGAIAEFERSLMLERQRDGIRKAMQDGKYLGRKATARAKSNLIAELWQQGKTAETTADILDVSRASVFRVLKDLGLTRRSERKNLVLLQLQPSIALQTTEPPTAMVALNDNPNHE